MKTPSDIERTLARLRECKERADHRAKVENRWNRTFTAMTAFSAGSSVYFLCVGFYGTVVVMLLSAALTATGMIRSLRARNAAEDEGRFIRCSIIQIERTLRGSDV